MLLSNHLIYENRLKCGSEVVARRGLLLDKKPCEEIFGSSHIHSKRDCWIQRLMREE